MFKTTALDHVGNAYVDKNVGTSTPGTRLEADDMNIKQDELVNSVESSGQTLDPTGVKDNQVARAMFLNGVGAQSMVDGGTANAKVLTPVTGASGYVVGESYAQLTGAAFIFKNATLNTGAVTINIGQTAGTLLGVKSLTQPGGAALVGSELIAGGYALVLYDLANDRFELIYSTEIAQLPARFKGFVDRPKFIYTETLKYDGGSGLFVEGETVTGAGGATGIVVAVDGNVTAGYLFINTRNAVAYVNDEVLTGSIAGVAVADGASTKDSMVLSPFNYHHNGTTEQLVYSDSKIGFRFGSGGSNVNSTDLAVDDFFYLYLDDSAIVTSGVPLITDGELVAVITEPAPSDAKHGEYNGNDRCIFGVLTDGSSDILEFFHDGGEDVEYGDGIIEVNNAQLTTTFADVDLSSSVPKFATRAWLHFLWLYSNADVPMLYRTKGQTGATGRSVCRVASDGTSDSNAIKVTMDSSQVIQTRESGASTNTYYLYTHSWCFPAGM